MEYYGTLGPACASPEILERMFRAGMTGIRLNLSHGDLEENGFRLAAAGEAAARLGIRPEILIDLRGPEVRIGRWKEENGPRSAETGALFRFGDGGLPVPDAFLAHASAGDHILLDDGRLEFLALECSSGGILARTLRGGQILPEKSLALAGKEIPMPVLTESDLRNIRCARSHGVTGVMLPFVRSREDLLTLRRALREADAGEIRIFAKIENLQGVRNLEELLPEADVIVIARGDLGNAMPLWELPGVQKRMASLCRKAGKPFMVVTQLLDSMEKRAVPTRAEVSDIYNAAADGASSLMLTGETAVGEYPSEAMEYLVRTGEAALKDIKGYGSAQMNGF